MNSGEQVQDSSCPDLPCAGGMQLMPLPLVPLPLEHCNTVTLITHGNTPTLVLTYTADQLRLNHSCHIFTDCSGKT